MNSLIQNVLDGLRAGQLQLAYENKEYLNDVAIKLYETPVLNKSGIEDLKGLILIANITYNDTDKDLLPFEDGIYDLLLEKYKKYDSNFQVGAEIIQFNKSNNDKIFVEKSFKQGLIFMDQKEANSYQYKDNIMIDPRDYMNVYDFMHIDPPKESYVTKRLHDTQHNHPELVGTLDKCKFTRNDDAKTKGVFDDANVKIVERDFFYKHYMEGIIGLYQPIDLVFELKYDGLSVEADCTDVVVSARSRGDTGIGQASDLTPILAGYKFPHRKPGSGMVGVKFEAIMLKSDLEAFNIAKGTTYKNCRTAIIGLFASSDAYKYRDFITLVPLAIEKNVFEEFCGSDRVKEIELLNDVFVSKGCPLRYAVSSGLPWTEQIQCIQNFVDSADYFRSFIPFMYDGVVVSYRDPVIREALGRENFINKYSIAVKFNPLKKQSIFRGYTFTVGQDGSITPMIHYDPVEFYGTIHPKSSGHSYARFMELGLRKGDIIDIEYVNDVMPYVSKPYNEHNIANSVNPPEPFPTVCPICGSPLVISSSGKSIRCMNVACGGRDLARMVNTCAKLNMFGFGEATVNQLGKTHLKDMIEEILHPNADKVLSNKGFGPVEIMNLKDQVISLLRNPITDAALLGAIGFTSVSTKTFELIFSKIDWNLLRWVNNDIHNNNILGILQNIKGIGPATIDTIVNEIDFFRDDIDFMMDVANIKHYKPTCGKKIRATGFRDAALFEQLRAHGFDADDNGSLTKDTDILLVPSEGFTSTKTQKATTYGIMIVPVNDFMENINKYL